jgi:hypothetical protein
MGKIAAYYYQGGVTPLTTQVTVPVGKAAENNGFGWLSRAFGPPLQIKLSEYACQGQVWLRVCQAAGALATDFLPHGSHDLLYSYALSGSFAKRDQISFQALVLFHLRGSNLYGSGKISSFRCTRNADSLTGV